MSIKDQISKKEPRWYAVKCKYRCEKNLKDEFLSDGIEVYVPIQKKVRQYASRKKQSAVALIPSHIFVKIIQSEYLSILQHMHVFEFLNFSGVLVPIPESEMELMKRVVGEGRDVELSTNDFNIGDQVEIIGGELTGVKGKMISVDNHNVLVELSTMGMGLTLNIEPQYLRRV